MPPTPKFRNIRAVIADFDLTIADTASDLIESKLYAMRQLGQPEPDRDLIRALLGMNVRDSFYVFSDLANEVTRPSTCITVRRSGWLLSVRDASSKGSAKLSPSSGVAA